MSRKRPDDMILMQLDGVGSIAVIAYQIVRAGIATGKASGGLHPHFHSVDSTPATAHQIRCHRRDNRHIHAVMSCRPAPEGWEWWTFSYIKSCRSPASLSCRSVLPAPQCIFSGQTRKRPSNSTLRPSFCTVATCFPVIRSCSAARQRQVLPVASFILFRIRYGRNLPVFSCWLLHHPLPAGSPAAH